MDALDAYEPSETAVHSGSQAQEMLQAYELLRSELRVFLKPEAAASILDEACMAVSAGGCVEPLREMRAIVAARLLDQVGAFLLHTAQGPVAGPDEDDHPPYVGDESEDELPTRHRPDQTRDHRVHRSS